MSFPQLKTCRVSFYLGNGVSVDAIVTGPFGNDADAKREALTRILKQLNALPVNVSVNHDSGRVMSEIVLSEKPSNVEQMLGGAK